MGKIRPMAPSDRVAYPSRQPLETRVRRDRQRASRPFPSAARRMADLLHATGLAEVCWHTPTGAAPHNGALTVHARNRTTRGFGSA